MANSAFRRHLIHTCQVRRNSSEPPPQNNEGEPVPDWDSRPIVGARRSCRYVEKAERLASKADGFPVLMDHMLLMDSGEDVLKTDLIDDIRDVDGNLVDAGPWRIMHVLTRRTRNAHHISMNLERAK